MEFLFSYEDWTNIQIDTEYEVIISFDGRGEIIYKEYLNKNISRKIF